MPRQRWEQRSDGVTLNVIGGLLGGLVAGFAMEHFQRALGRISPDIGGDLLARTATGDNLSPDAKPAASAAIHYAFAGAVGAIYGAAATRTPDITAWGGVPFGATVWLIADEMGMSAAGLAKPPSEYPLQDHAATLTSHLIYGATTEAVRRCVVATLRR